MQICGVCDIILLLLLEPFLYVGSTHAEQRTEDVAVARLDARKAMYASAAKQVEEDGLYGVILMMGHADGLCIDILPELFEILIAQFAGCHLDADLVQTGIGAGVEMDDVEGDVLLLAEPTGEGFVTMALVAPQQEVAMDGLHLIAQLL